MRSQKLQTLRKALVLLLALAAFAVLALESGPASKAAGSGLQLCARVIIPSLLPFFVLSNLLSTLGLAKALSRLLSPFMQKLFQVSGAGAAAFLIGLTGGYPLGAATAAELYRRGELSESEIKRLLCFCNNTGPAFIIGAAGSGIFGSAAIGALLYAAHILAAVITGLLFSRRRTAPVSGKHATLSRPVEDFSVAFPDAVSAAVRSTVTICGYVVFFSVVTGVLDALGVFSATAGVLAQHGTLSLSQARALLTGILELGSGIGAMFGQTPTAGSLSLCAFILGWGGLSVQFQTRAVLSGTPLAGAPLLSSKLLHGVLSAALAYLFGSLCL